MGWDTGRLVGLNGASTLQRFGGEAGIELRGERGVIAAGDRWGGFAGREPARVAEVRQAPREFGAAAFPGAEGQFEGGVRSRAIHRI